MDESVNPMKRLKPPTLPLDLRAGQTVLGLTLRLQQVHLLWWLVVAIWLLAALLLVRWLPALQGQYAATELQRQQLQTQLLNHISQPVSLQAASKQDTLELFTANLGDPRHVEQQLKTLFVIARDLDLKLPQGQYKLKCEDKLDYCKYTIVLPVEGSYVRIRTFVEQTLRAIHFASVDEVSFRREAVGDGEVQTRLRISLYTRTPQAAQRPAATGRPAS
jgi:hypothetical protein